MSDPNLMEALGALFTEAVAEITKAASKAAGGDRELAVAILRSALSDMEAIQRADFISAVYDARRKRSDEGRAQA